MKIARHDIAQAILHLLEQGHAPAQVATSVASYLIAERRTRELEALMRDIETLRFAEDGIVEATVVSARDLDDSVRETIKQLLQAKDVQIHHHLATHVVGGVHVRALDKQLDLSIESKLKRLKNITNNAA